jgi:hypothetical protein
MGRNTQRLAAAVMMTLVSASTHGADCAAESGARRVALLELYTSEGCNSCPPADRWVSGLPGRGHTPDRVVALAFHVDYWDYLGWPDPFSRPQFSERQRAASIRNRARVVYTPQLLLNGRDYRRGIVLDDLGERVGTINRDTARASIRLRVRGGEAAALGVSARATVTVDASRADARVFLALYENNLSNEVKAGENRGKQLRHDFVVRELAGPFQTDSAGEALLERRFDLDPRWKIADLNVAAFVQNERSGDVLQSLAMPICR